MIRKQLVTPSLTWWTLTRLRWCGSRAMARASAIRRRTSCSRKRAASTILFARRVSRPRSRTFQTCPNAPWPRHSRNSNPFNLGLIALMGSSPVNGRWDPGAAGFPWRRPAPSDSADGRSPWPGDLPDSPPDFGPEGQRRRVLGHPDEAAEELHVEGVSQVLPDGR